MSMRRLQRATVLAACMLTSAACWAWAPTRTRIIQCPGGTELRYVYPGDPPPLMPAPEPLWSDGYLGGANKVLGPPIITRCDDGGPMFWLTSARVVAEVPFGASPPPSVRPVRHLSADELLQAIDQGLGDTPDRLLRLRLHAWWAVNQVRRAEVRNPQPVAVGDFPPGSPQRANLEALVATMNNEGPETLLLKVEALRELSRFDEAQALLESPALAVRRRRADVAIIAERVRLRDALVVMLPVEP